MGVLCVTRIFPIMFKGCLRNIFASLFLKSKREHLWNLEKCFFFSIQKLFSFFVRKHLGRSLFLDKWIDLSLVRSTGDIFSKIGGLFVLSTSCSMTPCAVWIYPAPFISFMCWSKLSKSEWNKAGLVGVFLLFPIR